MKLWQSHSFQQVDIFLLNFITIIMTLFRIILVGEVGGYLGMILGVSFLDAEIVIKILLSMFYQSKRFFK